MESLTSLNSGTPVPSSTWPPGLRSDGVAQVQHRGGPTCEVSGSSSGQSPPPSSRPATCLHSWEYLGTASALHPRCERPTRLMCRLCAEQHIGRCGSTRASRCRPCGESHRRRLVEVIKSGTTGQRFGQYFWCTITAPGADSLPWDSERCNHRTDIECSGKLGCRVDGFDAAVWNGTCPRRWSWFMTYLRRRIGEQVQYCGSWEYQERGVLHRHFLIRVERPTTEKRVRAAVRGAARRWDFGSQYKVEAITGECARQVWYLAKYSAKTVDAVDGRPVLDVRTGEIKETRGFRAWSASRQWGETMKSVKDRQRCFAIAAGGSRGAPAPATAAAGAAGLESNPDISTITPTGELPALVGSASSTPL